MHTTIQELIYNVNGAEAIFLQLKFYLNNSLIVKIDWIANWLEESLNLFYAMTCIFNTYSIKIQCKRYELTVCLFTPIFYFVFIYLCMHSSILLGVFVLYLVFFKIKFIVFNSFVLDILHDDSSSSSEGDTTSSDSDEPTDTNVDGNDQDDSLDDNEYPMLLIKLELALFDVKGIINTLVAYRRSQDENNEECPATDAFIEKLMHSPDISLEDLSHLEKIFKPTGLKSIKQKLLNLNKKRLYSPKEVLKLILNLNKLKNSMLILPNGIIILTQHKTKLNLLSLPSILKVSRRNLKHIVNMLNLNKKLNLYLTKECYKSGDLWEKSFYVADFLCKLDEKFNKNYLILEDVAPHIFKETKLKADYLECDDLLFEETIFVLEQISKKFSYRYNLKKKTSSCLVECFVGEALSNRISMDVVLENIVNIKKTPPKAATAKTTWKQYFKNFLNYVKSKWHDLTIPAIVTYYYIIKLIFLTSLKYLVILVIFLWFLYKYVYLNNNIWTKLQFAAWAVSLGAYLYFLWILFFGNVYWITRNTFHYVKFYFRRFLLFDFILISLIYFSYICLNLLYLTDCVFTLWYNTLIYVYNYLLIKFNFYTLFSIYLSPFWYVYANIKIFISYAWGISYYRDPFICYFSKFLALWYLYLFPYLVNVTTINAGKISSLLRWLNWNRHFFSILKKFIFYCINLIYTHLKITVCFWLEDLTYFYRTWIIDFVVRYLLLYFLLYITAFILLFYLFLWYFSLKNKKKDYTGFKEYCDFSDTFGDRIKEKMFDLIPLRYKLSWEFLNIEWLKVLNNSSLFYIKYINILYVFITKKLWLYIKNTIYTRFEESLVEFYCEMHLWIEYYLFKYLGDFLELYFYIPYYVKVTTIYVTEIVWLTFMDMHMLVKFFGIKPIIHSIEAYVRYRASLLKYQYWFWKNYQYQYNRKRLCYQHAFILFYWNLYLRFQHKQRSELSNKVLKSWYIWWIQHRTDY